ncbi:MAG: hypothetical protein RR716_07805, partial [Christensenellaceae bacterium]
WYDYVILAVVFIFMMLCLMHSDLRHTVSCSFALCNGHWTDFYTYNAKTISMPDYDIVLYLIFALWNVPMMLAGKTMEMPGTISVVMLYNKLLPVIFLVLCAYMVYRIARKIDISPRKSFYAAMLMLTVPYIFIIIAGMGMYDSIYLFFILWGIYFLIGNGKRWEKIAGLLLFGISFGIKPLGAFILIPMLLYKEKNILKVLAGGLIAMVPYVLCKLPFIGTMGAGGVRFVQNLFASAYGPEFFSVSLFCVAYILICAWVYHKQTEKDKPLKFLYIGMLALLPFYAFVPWNPQWLIAFVPFFALFTAISTHKNKYLLYDGILAVLFIGWIWAHYTEMTHGINPFGENAVAGSILPRLMQLSLETPYVTTSVFPMQYAVLYLSGIVALLCFMVYQMNPWRNGAQYELMDGKENHSALYGRLHFMIPILVFMIPIVVWIIQAAS